MRLAQTALLIAFAAGPVLAQVQPIPGRPLTPPGSPLDRPAPQPIQPTLPPRTAAPGLPNGPMQMLARPQITLVSPPPAAGRVAAMRFRLTNLGDASAAHLFAFTPGCAFDQSPGISNLPLRIDRRAIAFLAGNGDTSLYTTSFGRWLTDAQGPEGAGIPVTNGVAEITIQGVPGARGGLTSPADELRTPDSQSLLEANALARYQRSVGGGGTCEPQAFVMVRDPDNVWRLLNPDGSRNTTFRTDGSQRRIGGGSFSLRGRRTISFTHSADLRARLAPFMQSAGTGSVCEGTSSALNSPDYSVGLRERDGDLVFRLRSGPNGTRCALGMRLGDLPEGTTATARFSVTRDGDKCRVGSGALLTELLVTYATLFTARGFLPLERGSQMVMPPVRVEAGSFTISETGWLNPFDPPSGGERFSWQANGTPMVGMLFCEATLVNDHGLDLRLDSIDVTVPDGVSFP